MLLVLISLCFFYSTHAAQEWQPEQNRTHDNSHPVLPAPRRLLFTPINNNQNSEQAGFVTPPVPDHAEEARIAEVPPAPRKNHRLIRIPQAVALNKGGSNIK